MLTGNVSWPAWSAECRTIHRRSQNRAQTAHLLGSLGTADELPESHARPLAHTLEQRMPSHCITCPRANARSSCTTLPKYPPRRFHLQCLWSTHPRTLWNTDSVSTIYRDRPKIVICNLLCHVAEATLPPQPHRNARESYRRQAIRGRGYRVIGCAPGRPCKLRSPSNQPATLMMFQRQARALASLQCASGQRAASVLVLTAIQHLADLGSVQDSPGRSGPGGVTLGGPDWDPLVWKVGTLSRMQQLLSRHATRRARRRPRARPRCSDPASPASPASQWAVDVASPEALRLIRPRLALLLGNLSLNSAQSSESREPPNPWQLPASLQVAGPPMPRPSSLESQSRTSQRAPSPHFRAMQSR